MDALSLCKSRRSKALETESFSLFVPRSSPTTGKSVPEGRFLRCGPNGKGLSRKAIMSEVEHSLARLGTDYIDLYQIHRNDHATPLAETLEALSDLVKVGKVRYLGASSMPAREFAKALHIQRERGLARFVSMQDHYNLLAREEEREMLPLCADESVGTIVWSPLARGRLARPWGESTTRSTSDAFAELLYLDVESDRATIDAVGVVANTRGVSHAQVALAWLRTNLVVVAPIVGASSVAQIDDAVASLELALTMEEIATLEAHYTPRHDFQGISEDADLQGVMARIPGFAPAS